MKRTRGIFSVGDQEMENIKKRLELWTSRENHLRNAPFFDVCVGFSHGILTDEMKRGLFVNFKGTEEEKVPFFNLLFRKLINEGIAEKIFNLYFEDARATIRAVFNNNTFHLDVPAGDLTLSNFCFTQHRYAQAFGDKDMTKMSVPCGGGKFIITGWKEMVRGLEKISAIITKVSLNEHHFERLGITRLELKFYLTFSRNIEQWETLEFKHLVSDLTFGNPFEHKNLALDYVF